MDHSCYLCFMFVSWFISDQRVRLVHCETRLSPPVEYFLLTVPRRCFFCGSFMLFLSCFLCFYARLFIDALWSPAGRGRTFSGVWFWICHFPTGILAQVWCLSLSIPDLCSLSYFYYLCWYIIMKTKDMHTSIICLFDLILYVPSASFQ